MVDELIYSELAKSLAAHGTFAVRDVPASGFGVVYPALVAPAWRVFDAVPSAYVAAKAVNAVVMSLAAIPAYLLGRRLLRREAAFAAAVLTVLVPSMLYTGTLMTENAFYPLFLLATLAVVACLERPTPLRQVVLLALVALTYETRQQGVVLLPAAALAPLVLGLLERDVRARLRGWLPFYALASAACAVVALAYWLRDSSPLAALGAYRGVASNAYEWPTAARYALWHVAELDLYVGVVPFAALLLLWLSPHGSPAARRFLAATLPLAVLLVIEVAVFASSYSLRIEERYLFYLAPFAFIALAAVAERVVALDRRAAAASILAAGVLPVAIPFGRFVNRSAAPDTLALLPWWSLNDHGLAFGAMRWVALAASLVAALLLLAPHRARALPVVAVAGYLLVVSAIAYGGRHGMLDAARSTVRAGIQGRPYDWIDRAVGPGADVALLWDGAAPIQYVWENELFNRSVGDVVTTAPPYPDGLPATRLHDRGDGTLVTAAGRPFTARFALVPPSVSLAGAIVARDGDDGSKLVRVDGALRTLATVTGLYPGDVWSGRTVTYTRRQCTGGRLDVELASDASLFRDDQTVTASAGGRRVVRVAVPPTGTVRVRVPVHPTGARVCVVRFTVAKVRVPAKVVAGSTDTRALGVRFLAIDYAR
jgi:4-amino-4-deoxy-L-arabinose transferase-like glycosyltransferase